MASTKLPWKELLLSWPGEVLGTLSLQVLSRDSKGVPDAAAWVAHARERG